MGLFLLTDKDAMNTLLVADGLNLLHRGYFATPEMTNSEGIPTNALKGLVNILMADIKRVTATHCAVVFDRPGKPTFRHKIYPEYKANRPHNGADLRPVLLPAKKLLNAMGIRVYGTPGIEGDDLIGSIAVRLSKSAKVFISSNDKDFASLVNNRIHMLKPKGLVLDVEGVFNHWGVRPNQMVDYLMMLGDSSDNIPGINKVGPKTAAKLLAEHGTLKAVCRDATLSSKMQVNFDNARKHFELTRKLITVDTSLVPNIKLSDTLFSGLQPELRAICDDLNFNSTYTQILNTLGN